MEAPRETVLEPGEYLRSLNVEREINEVYGLDGAALYRVADDHFVIMACREHEGHNGHALLRRVLPAHWGVFSEGVNTEAQFHAFHYGPVDN